MQAFGCPPEVRLFSENEEAFRWRPLMISESKSYDRPRMRLWRFGDRVKPVVPLGPWATQTERDGVMNYYWTATSRSATTPGNSLSGELTAGLDAAARPPNAVTASAAITSSPSVFDSPI
jgi:hypothetical protein